MNKIKSEDNVETIINGVRVINFPKDEGAISRLTVENIIYAIPELLRNAIIIDYQKIGPEIFAPIKAWYHEFIEADTVENDGNIPIVCTDCFGRLIDDIVSETHNYDSGNGTQFLILHGVPQRRCQSCNKLHKEEPLAVEIEQLLDDFFLFHLNGRVDIPKETDLNTLRKFKGASKKASEFREKALEAKKQGVNLSVIEFLTSTK